MLYKNEVKKRKQNKSTNEDLWNIVGDPFLIPPMPAVNPTFPIWPPEAPFGWWELLDF